MGGPATKFADTSHELQTVNDEQCWKASAGDVTLLRCKHKHEREQMIPATPTTASVEGQYAST
jgi:hypothetical protein